MTIKPLFLLTALLIGTSPAIWSAEKIAGAEPDKAFSAANQALFLSDHLTDIDYPVLFHYVFKRRGTLEKGFTESIDMTSRDAPNGAKHVEFRYFSEKRRRPMHDVSNARGNPIIMVFLQRDINEMERLTGGHWRYFQKRIKLALENNAQVEPVTFEYDGKNVEGTRIRIEPYVNDPHRREIGDYADKYYEFILSENVPGDVYEMRTVVIASGKPTTDEDNRVLLEERLTLDHIERLEIKEAKNN